MLWNKTPVLFLLLVFLCLASLDSFSQPDIQTLRQDSINQLKLDGKLTGNEYFINSLAKQQDYSIATGSLQNSRLSPPPTCKCWISRDTSWRIAAFDGSGASGGPGVPPDYRNDDWSTLPIHLPFSFCFYGTQVDSLYINNNGNVSVGAPYSTFTATAFPNNTFVMIAPFWGDVDTRGALSGLVYYQITPTHLVVQWENVGYFNSHDDKTNTFQLILTDGTDPILPGGQNTSFCYKDMQWTTGDASSGTNGFGGTPATVGVNRGNGTDYIQVGLFDTSGAVYDGPFGNNDGIDVLDNQSFYFNSCVSSSNVAPLVTALQVCDTLKVCINDSIQIYAEFLSPEQNQITVPGVNSNGMTGVSVLNSSTGNTASITVQIVGLSSNIGYHTIYITGTDNGVPPLTNSTPVIVQVMPAPHVDFTYFPPSPIPPGTTVQFTNLTVGAFSYIWDFGDGSPTSNLRDPSHTYVNSGTYEVTLRAIGPNGCGDELKKQIIVVACSVAEFTVDDTLCSGEIATVNFNGFASSAAILTWDFGNATVLSGSNRGPFELTWNNAGNQRILLTLNDSGCPSDTVSHPVYVVPVPDPSILTDTSLCIGGQSTLAFNGTAQSNAIYTWDFGSASVLSGTGAIADPFILQWNQSGNSTVGLMVNQNGCIDSSSVNVQVLPLPLAGFAINPSACENSPVQINYTGSSTGSANYNWDFNGAMILSGSGQGPYEVSWASAGIKTIVLTVSENGCNSVPATNSIAINAKPLALFDADSVVCPGNVARVSFTGNAEPGALFTWNFDRANVISGSGSGPYNLSWNTAGIKTLSLVVDQNSCTDSSSLQVSVNPVPGSEFSLPSSACPGDTINVSYTGISGPYAQFDWNFNGAQIISGSGRGPYSIRWLSGGSGVVSLLVTDNNCPGPPTQHNLIIEALPFVNAGNDTVVCSGSLISLGDAPVPGTNYSWTPVVNLLNPDSSRTMVEAVNNDLFPLTRHYILQAVSAGGCVNHDTVDLMINPVPVASFTPQNPQCLDDNKFQFYLSGTILPGASYQWTFGASAVPSLSNQQIPPPVHFSQLGTFPVTVEASFGACQAVPFTDSIRVSDNPLADFDALNRQGCVPLTVSLVNLSSGDDNTYQWYFSDLGSDTATNAIHTFTQPGTYSVELVARNYAGCTDHINYQDIITVYPAPSASFTPLPESTDILEPLIKFINKSAGAYRYSWQFGDGDSTESASPEHMYKETGTYTVTLYTENIYGCRDTITGLVRIEDTFTFYIPNSFTPNGDGRNDTFGGYGTRFSAYHLDILDRWGIVIYSTDDYSQPWDGRVQNAVQQDTYIYKITITDQQFKSHVFTGHVTVVR